MSELGFRTAGRVRHRRFRGCLAALVALAVLGGGGFLLAQKGQEALAGLFVTPDYDGGGTGKVLIEVRDGQSASDIGLTLEKKDVVKSADAFTRAAKDNVRSRSVQPGFYNLRSKMGGKEALSLLLNPTSRVLKRVAIPEGLRLSETLNRLSKESSVGRGQFDSALKDAESLGLPSYAKGNAEGFLFPATYDLQPNTTASDILRQMISRYNAAEGELQLTSGAADLKRTPLQIVTVASLIEKEAQRPEDFGKVSRVIYNRIARGQRLQLDSTVHYAVNKAGRVSTTAKDRANPSPYNTYKHEGLPPGPISSPGEQALDAALNPTPGGWLYFVTTDPDTGATAFATTMAGHERNVVKFQAWCKKHRDRC